MQKSIYVQAGLEVCCHWHRLVCPLRYYHRAKNYRIVIDTTIRHQKGSYDFCFIHGMIAPEELAAIGSSMHRGAKIIWAIDDDYFGLPDSHPHKPLPVNLGSMRVVSEICHAAIFTTPELMQKTIGHLPSLAGKSLYATNLLDPNHYQPNWEMRKERRKPLVMWIGSPTHDADLEILIPVVKALCEDWSDKLDLVFFGSCHPEMRAKWVGSAAKEFSGCNFSAYPTTLRDFSPDIMLCPLAEDDFARGRSDLKLKEAMALGTHFFYSPVGPFRKFDYGFRCQNADDFLLGVIGAAKEFGTDKFWNLCKLNRQVAEREFFWGRKHQAQEGWDYVLDSVLGEA